MKTKVLIQGFVLVWKNGEVYCEKGCYPVFKEEKRAKEIEENVPTAYGCRIVPMYFTIDKEDE